MTIEVCETSHYRLIDRLLSACRARCPVAARAVSTRSLVAVDAAADAAVSR